MTHGDKHSDAHSDTHCSGISYPVTSALTGIVDIPGDKSISHRALILGALATGQTTIKGLLEGGDVLATGKAMEKLGATISRAEDGTWTVTGCGPAGLRTPDTALNFGNSGTGARLIMGAIAGHPISATCKGDASLSNRPMGRVTEPLSRMGARFESAKGEMDALRLPLTLHGPQRALPISYEVPVPSAQVKSAILLAGLGAPGKTCVIERTPTRDHTERMLQLFGAEVETKNTDKGVEITLTGEPTLKGTQVIVPGDPSSAAFPLVAALLVVGSKIRINNILVNPHRDGLWHCLREMGAQIEEVNRRKAAGETVADYDVSASTLNGINVPAERAPSMIDEYPILAMAAAIAEGETRLNGLAELRVKESDRLSAVTNGLKANGVAVEELEDGMIIQGCGGKVPGGGTVTTHLDHRIAMSFMVLGLAADKPIMVDDTTMIMTSFPNFFDLMGGLGTNFIQNSGQNSEQNSVQGDA